MNASKDNAKTKVELCTQNPVHHCEFTWNIDNATKFSRRLNSHEFPDESICKPRFRIVAKFNEKYPEISNVNIGIQRVDDGKEVIYMSVEISLTNSKAITYRTKELNYTSCSDGSPNYCFSELFTTSPTILEFEPRTYPVCVAEIEKARRKTFIGSYMNESEVFVLPDDQLIVHGTIKSYGCCVITKVLPSIIIQDEYAQMSHVSQLLQELQTAYEQQQMTDVELIVEGETIHAHRYILSLRSPVFRRMFEYDTQEKATGKVYITDMEKQVVEDFVWYLYTGVVKEESWAFMCALYSTAEKYEVHFLRLACSLILRKLIDQDSVCGILELADLYHDECLKEPAMDYIAKYFSKIKNNEEWLSIINHNSKLAGEVLLTVSKHS